MGVPCFEHCKRPPKPLGCGPPTGGCHSGCTALGCIFVSSSPAEWLSWSAPWVPGCSSCECAWGVQNLMRVVGRHQCGRLLMPWSVLLYAISLLLSARDPFSLVTHGPSPGVLGAPPGPGCKVSRSAVCQTVFGFSASSLWWLPSWEQISSPSMWGRRCRRCLGRYMCGRAALSWRDTCGVLGGRFKQTTVRAPPGSPISRAFVCWRAGGYRVGCGASTVTLYLPGHSGWGLHMRLLSATAGFIVVLAQVAATGHAPVRLVRCSLPCCCCCVWWSCSLLLVSFTCSSLVCGSLLFINLYSILFYLNLFIHLFILFLMSRWSSSWKQILFPLVFFASYLSLYFLGQCLFLPFFSPACFFSILFLSVISRLLPLFSMCFVCASLPLPFLPSLCPLHVLLFFFLSFLSFPCPLYVLLLFFFLLIWRCFCSVVS